MSIVLISIICVLLVILARFIFNKWINPVIFYVIPWSLMLILYEIRLLRYYDLSAETWIITGSAFLSFLLGVILIKTAYHPQPVKIDKPFFKDPRILGYLLFFFSFVALIDAVIHWGVLFRMYGSLPKILINANEIYRLRVESGIPGVIPYLVAFGYAAVFVAAVLSAYRAKITLVSLIPLVIVTLKEIANVGRAGILISLMLYLMVYFFTRNILKDQPGYQKIHASRKQQFIGLVLVVALLIAGATLVRSIRGTYESFAGATKALSHTRGGLLITPSIYLYFSSHIGVLNQALKDDKEFRFGENSLLTAYSILSKFDLIERPPNYQKGYRMPFWSNTGTYLREIREDYGYAGLFIVPFLLGVTSAFFWFRLTNKKDLLSLVSLSYVCLIIAFSFIAIVTRLGIWTISLTLLLVTAAAVPYIEKLFLKKKSVYQQNV